MTIKSQQSGPRLIAQERGSECYALVVPARHVEQLDELTQSPEAAGVELEFVAAAILKTASRQPLEDTIIAHAHVLSTAHRYLLEHEDVPILAKDGRGLVGGVAATKERGLTIKSIDLRNVYGFNVTSASSTNIKASFLAGSARQGFEARGSFGRRGELCFPLPACVVTPDTIDDAPDLLSEVRYGEVLAVGKSAVAGLIATMTDKDTVDPTYTEDVQAGYARMIQVVRPFLSLPEIN